MNQVMHAIRDGRITPTERDPFDPTDFLQGPSMYTVTELLDRTDVGRVYNTWGAHVLTEEGCFFGRFGACGG